MVRIRSRELLVPPAAEWFAVRDSTGAWQIVNRAGESVLRHADPLERAEAVHLAAQAPQLRAILAELALIVRATLDTGALSRRRAEQLVEAWHYTAALCRPRWEVAAEIERHRHQQQIDFDVA